MSATTSLLAIEQFAKKAAIGVDEVGMLLKLRLLRPAFISKRRTLFREEQIEEAGAMLSRYRGVTPECAQLLTTREMSRRTHIPIWKLSRAILAKTIEPDFSIEGKRPAYFFGPERVDQVRSIMNEKTQKKRKPKALLQEPDLFTEGHF
jgi:hypothetical protein